MDYYSFEFVDYYSNLSLELNASEGYERACRHADTFEYVDWTQLAAVRVFFTLAYVVVISVALVGNSLVVITILRHQHMRTSTTLFLLNLALCDFFISCLAIPLRMLEYLAPCDWNVFRHDVTCSLCGLVLPIFVFTSVLTMCAISIGRYAFDISVFLGTGFS